MKDISTKGNLDEIFHHLEKSFEPWCEKRIAAFLKQRATDKWIIATDFCIDDSQRPNDSFAYTILPAGEQLKNTENLVRSVPQRDLKKVKTPPNSMIRLLTKGKVFSVCFVVDRKRKFFRDAEDLRNHLSLSIEMMERWDNASSCEDIILKMRNIKREVEKKSINIKLISDILLASLFGAFLSYIISKNSHAQCICWMPDRDKITDSYSNIAHTLFHINTSSLCQRSDIVVPSMSIATQENDDLWCDPFIRIADYVAGAAAAWDPPANDPVTRKIALMIRKVFCGNRYLGLFRVAFSVIPNNRFSCQVSRLHIEKIERNGTNFSNKIEKLNGLSRILHKI